MSKTVVHSFGDILCLCPYQNFHVVFQRTAKKCTEIYNARAYLLFCSLNFLFSDVLVAVAVVVILGYVHTKPDKFEIATIFIRIGLPSTLKRRFRCPKTELFENALQSG